MQNLFTSQQIFCYNFSINSRLLWKITRQIFFKKYVKTFNPIQVVIGRKFGCSYRLFSLKASTPLKGQTLKLVECVWPFRAVSAQLFHDVGLCLIETSPLICSANQWTGFYMIGVSVMKELTEKQHLTGKHHQWCPFW